jgi:hypothetical protein
MSSVVKYLIEQGGLMTTTARANFLFAFPMIACVGLPPMLMFHYHYRENPMVLLATMVTTLPSPIFLPTTSGSSSEPCVDLQVLGEMLKIMASQEKELLTAISEVCIKSASGAVDSSLCDLHRVEWEHFRLLYYNQLMPRDTTGESDLIAALERGVRRRCAAYLTGLLCLSDVYGGWNTSDDAPVNKIEVKLHDAPLATDFLGYVMSLAEKTRYVTFPTVSPEPDIEKVDTNSRVLKQNRLIYYHVPPM